MSNAQRLVERIKALPLPKQKSVCALLGATVADAATRPLHWIYNQQQLDGIVNDKQPEFWPESKSPFYTLPLGRCSGYNDTALATLSSLCETEGQLDIPHVCERLKMKFGEGSDYADAFSRRTVPYNAERRSEFVGPIEGPWLQKAMLTFLKNYEAGETILGGSDCNEHDGFCAALPLIVKHAGEPNMWVEAKKLCSLLTSHQETLAMFHTEALLVGLHVSGKDDCVEEVKDLVESLYPDVYELITEAEEAVHLPYVRAVETMGKACYLPGSFQGGLLTLLRSSSYVEGVRMNIMAGGCNCCRANVVGACLGAKYGIERIPLDWLAKVVGIEEIGEMAINFVMTN